MRLRTPLLTTFALATVLATAACGESGSSGTGGTAAGSGEAASGDACAPVAGDQLVVLEDDQNLQNADNVVPVLNAAFASANPAAVQALDAVSAVLTTDDLIELNNQVDVQRQDAAEVAQAYVDDNSIGSDVTGGSGAVVVGAGNFSESTILANVYADALTNAGFQATVQTTGNREVYLPAVAQGQLQAFPEYLATSANFISEKVQGSGTLVATGDVDETLAAVEPLAAQFGVTYGEASAAQDQNAFAVTTAFADALGVTTLSELADACGDGSLTLGGPTECPTRPACQLGLEDTYGLEFAGFQEYDAGGPLTKQAILNGDVSIGLVFSSDGSLAQQ